MPNARGNDGNGVRSQALAGALPIGLVLVATILVYGQVVRFDLLSWDDRLHLIDNPHLLPPTRAGLIQLWREPYFGQYIPVTYTFFAAETAVARLAARPGETVAPWVYHLGSLVLHLACTMVVYHLLSRLVGPGWGAASGAALFALHPLQVESVAWISETRNLLATLFSLLALDQYLSFAGARAPIFFEPQSQPDEPAAPNPRWRHFLAATGWFALALLSKPTAVAVPLVAAAIDSLGLGRRARQFALPLGAWCALGVGIMFVTSRQQPLDRLLDRASLGQRPLIAADALGFYLERLFFPIQLGPDHGRPPRRVLATPDFLALGAVVAAGFLFGFARPKRVWRTAVAVFVAALAPTLGLVPFAFQWVSTVADRYVYFAMLGPALAGAWLVTRSVGPRTRVACLVVLAGCAAASFLQTRYWRDDPSLFSRAIVVNPGSSIFQYNLGQYLHSTGDLAGAKRHYQASITAATSPSAHFNLGAILEREGQDELALEQYEFARKADPSLTKATRAKARLLVRVGQSAEAADCLRKALAGPADAELINDLAWLLATTPDDRLRDGAQAIALAQAACAATEHRRPEFLDTLAAALAASGRFEEAARIEQAAIELAGRGGNASMRIELEQHLRRFQGREPLVE